MASFFKKKGGGVPGSSAIQVTDVSIVNPFELPPVVYRIARLMFRGNWLGK